MTDATSIRPARVAGAFYRSHPAELRQEIEERLTRAPETRPAGEILAAAVPHAGYIYSADIAAPVFKALRNVDFDTVVIIGHDLGSQAPGIIGVIPNYTAFRTPLGEISVDTALCRALHQAEPRILCNDRVHAMEHMVEVQLPFLQVTHPGVRIVPMLFGEVTPEHCQRLATLLFSLRGDRKLFVLSSTDLSHYPPAETSRALDRMTVSFAERMDLEGLCRWKNGGDWEGLPGVETPICPAGGLETALAWAKQNGATRTMVLKRGNSGDISGDNRRVVGHSSLLFVKENAAAAPKNNAFSVSETSQKLLLELARSVIASGTQGKELTADIPDTEELRRTSAVFVTLHKHGQLRGCIGTTMAHLPLYRAVAEYAQATAFQDPRFRQVTTEELPELKVELSVLSPMRLILLSIVLLCASVFAEDFPPQNPARIQEIATYLRPTAGGFIPSWDDRAFWDAQAATEDGQKQIACSRKFLAEPIPDCPDGLYLEFFENGNRTNYEKVFYRRLDILEVCYFGELLENNGLYLERIVQLLNALCDAKSWILPAHDYNKRCFQGEPYIDLLSCKVARNISEAVATLSGKLPEETVRRCKEELRRRIFEPYLASARGEEVYNHWWFFVRTNWNAVCHNETVVSALQVLDDPMLRATFLEAAERAVPYYLDSFAADGYCSEGIGYWDYGFGNFLPMVLMVRAATGGKLDFTKIQPEKQHRIASYGIVNRLESGMPPAFADGTGLPRMRIRAWTCLLWPDLVPLEPTRFFLDTPFQNAIIFHLYANQSPAMDAVPSLPLHTHFPEGGVLISRSRSDAPHRLAVAFKGKHNDELHNHNDVGSYDIVLDGARMTGDPGQEEYTARTFSARRYESRILNSYGHPVPRVNDLLQGTGRDFAGVFQEVAFAEEMDRARLDMTAAYPREANLESLVRTMSFDRPEQRIVISDKVRFTTPGILESPVVSPLPWTETAPGEYLLCAPGGQKLAVRVAVEGASWRMVEDTIENPGRETQHRHAIRLATPVKTATISVEFRPVE